MKLKEAIESISGFKYMMDLLHLHSAVGRKRLQDLQFLTYKEAIEKELDETAATIQKLNDKQLNNTFSILIAKLEQLRDIKATFSRLASGNTLNDIDLFEVKHFAILSESIRTIVEELHLEFIRIPKLISPIDILDPEKKRIPHFFIYDQYSEKLAEIRAEINRLTQQNASEEKIENLRLQSLALEDEIRKEISEKLRPFSIKLNDASDEISKLDVLLAKADLAKKLNLARPLISDVTTLKGIFNPQVSASLESKGKKFQPVDIDIPHEPTVITGANMAGKSVLLKTVSLVQSLAQFGFYVPALSAEIAPVDKIIHCLNDEQDELRGLSSFAAEMLRLNEMADQVKKGEKILVLIDELARTTNPKEGKAIVCGMLDFLIEHNVPSLITTHYSFNMPCRKLRVKGFSKTESSKNIDIKNIHQHMDYSLEESDEKEVPHEAIRIAEIIGVDKDILRRTEKHLND